MTAPAQTTTPDRPALVLRGLRKSFGSAVAVDGVDLEVGRGEFVTLLGPSGSGKTTTLRMVAGFMTPSGGSIEIDGADMTRVPPYRRDVGMVFQNYALFPHMTAGQNIAFPLRMRRRPTAEISRRVADALSLVKLGDLGDRYPRQLSGGQQQRIALARADVFEPRVLLMDEPLGALDRKLREALQLEIIRVSRELGATVLYVTHDQEEALELSDRIVVMSEGRIEQIGTPFEIYNFPATAFVASFVGTLNAVQARIADPAARRLMVADSHITTNSDVTGAAGELVTVAIRPEMITLDGTGEGDGANRIPATVEDVAFLGSVVRVRTTIGDGSTISIDTFNNPNLDVPAAGVRVVLRFPPEACHVLSPDAVPDQSDELAAAEALL
jgi:putative spermidine/putrescine transport system ATP-binding protein